MRSIAKPADDVKDVYLNCLSLIRNANLKSRLSNCADLIIEASEELEKKVTTGQLHTIIQETLVNGNVSALELSDVYTKRMAKKNTPGRALYDKMKLTAPYEICPLCSQNSATTLDHYLPKAEYPRLSVTPINLVPSCFDCNKIKLAKLPNLSSEETLHPYYDNVENIEWLRATVIQGTPPSVRFSANPPDYIPNLLSQRIVYHFTSLELKKLYAIQAGSELRQINLILIKRFENEGALGVKSYLLEAMEARSHDNINSWQAALYRATSSSNWFCSGGFRLQV